MPDEPSDLRLALDAAKSDYANTLAIRKEQNRKLLHILQIDGLLLTVIFIGLASITDFALDNDHALNNNSLFDMLLFSVRGFMVCIIVSAANIVTILLLSNIPVKNTTLLSFDKDTSMYKYSIKNLIEMYHEMSVNVAKRSDLREKFIIFSVLLLLVGMIFLSWFTANVLAILRQ